MKFTRGLTTDFSLSPQNRSLKGNESRLDESANNSPRAVDNKKSFANGSDEEFAQTRIKNSKK